MIGDWMAFQFTSRFISFSQTSWSTHSFQWNEIVCPQWWSFSRIRWEKSIQNFYLILLFRCFFAISGANWIKENDKLEEIENWFISFIVTCICSRYRDLIQTRLDAMTFLRRRRNEYIQLLTKFQIFQIDWLGFRFFSDGQMFASGHILCGQTDIRLFAECSTDSTHIQSWQTVDAQEIPLTVIASVEFRCVSAEGFVLCFLWTAETQERFDITIWHEIGPIALIRIFVESQTERTLQNVATAIGTVFEFTAVRCIAHAIITELMRTFFGWL